MGGLNALAWRSVVARRLRSLLTVLGIALGVGVLVTSLAVDAGIERSIDRTVEELVGRADLRVSAFQERGLSDATVEAISAAPGVAVAVPVVEERTYLRTPIGAAEPDAPAVTVMGIDPILDPQVHELVVVQGAALARRDEPSAVISERLAREDGLGIGSELTVDGADGRTERFRVIGLVEGDGPLVGAFGRLVILPIDAAIRVFDLDGVRHVDLRLSEDAPSDAVEAELVATLTEEPYVLASPRDLAASLRASTADFRGTTALIAGVALFVGAFLIFNTLSMTVAERIREVGLLRAAGATRGQITVFVLAGASVLGIFGSILGLFVGAALSAAMGRYVTSVASVSIDRVEVSIPALLVAAAVGVAVTIAAALEPAWRAGRISPVEALRLRAEPARSQGARLRWLVAVFVAIAVVGLLVWPRGAGESGAARSLVVYAILLVAAVLSPLVLAPLARVAGAPFAGLGRLEERLARASLVRDRSRTALTVGALTIGLAMIVAIGGVAQNARRAAGAWLEGVVPGDVILTSIRPLPADQSPVADLAGLPGVERITPVAAFELAYQGVRLDAAAVVGSDLLADGRLTFAAGDRTAALTSLDEGGAVVVSRAIAERLGLRVGDTMGFPVGGGTVVDLRLTGIAERTIPGRAGETVLVGWTDALASFGVLGADFFAVRYAPDATTAQRAAVELAATGYALDANSLERVQEAVSDALGRVFGLFDALALVAVVVSALGIVNTLTMNVVERVRELGVLRATGMTRGQVGRMVVIEAGILGLLGAALGALTGLAAGAAMLVFGGSTLGASIEIPWVPIALCFVLGVGLSMAAAWYPSRLAGRLSIVRALQFE
jgi:putative ABC transport system permease protein